MASQSDNVTASTATCVDNWLPLAEQQMRAIEELPDGWDSEGAERPDARIVRAGVDLLRDIFSAVGVPKPHINPTPSGGVQFDWECGGKYLELELVDPTTAQIYYEDEETGEELPLKTYRPGQPLTELIKYLERFVPKG